MSPSVRKIALVTNVPAPYRFPVFGDLGAHPLVDLTVFFCTEPGSHRDWSSDVETERFSARVLDSFRIGVFDVAPGLFGSLLRGSYDAIITGTSFHIAPCVGAVIAASRINDTPVVAWNETISTRWDREKTTAYSLRDTVVTRVGQRVRARFDRYVFEHADHVVAFSRMAGEYVTDLGIAPETVTVAPQSVPPLEAPTTRPPEHARSPASNGRVVLSLGQLIERKGIDTLIETVKRIDDAELELWIAGRGPLRERLERLADGDDRIRFLGFVPENRKAALFARADLFVLPTRHDPWGLVVNEALACGTTAVTTEAAGCEMMLADEFVVPVDDPEALREVIVAALSGDLDAPRPAREAVTDETVMSRPLYEACAGAPENRPAEPFRTERN